MQVLVRDPKIHTNEHDHRSKPGIILGYSTQSKGYKIWDTESRVLVISRDVRIDESSLGSDTTTTGDSIKGSSSVDVA